jgi:2'-5' RNA ligase
MDRLYFAIFPDAAVAARMAQLAQSLRREHGLKGKAFDTRRLHVTLYYLGDYEGLPAQVVAAAIDAAATVMAPAFEIEFDRALSFGTRAANRPFVLGGGAGVAALTAFQRTLAAALCQCGLGASAQPQYTPHVTLLYDDGLVAEQPVEALRWKVREFVLMHSLLGRITRLPLARWPLGD